MTAAVSLWADSFLHNRWYCRTLRQKGGERIEMLKGGKGYINFRTRTGTGGLGEGLFSPQN
nr:hypothetical protein [Ruminococcus sp.]